MSEFLNREQLLASVGKLPSEVVDLPQVGGKVIVCGMSADAAMALQQSMTKPGVKPGEIDIDQAELAFKMVLNCVVDKDGKRLLTDDDVKVLRAGRGDIFQKLATVAMRLNGLAGDEGNLPAIP